MEELHTTEVLDREILEDGRKSAVRILKSADDRAASAKISWEQKLEQTLNETREHYHKKEENERNEIMARLPMDKRRIRLEKIESFLGSAMNTFVASLDRAKLLSLLERELVQRFEAVEPDAVAVSCAFRYRGLAKKEADALVQKTLKNTPLSIQEDPLYTTGGSFPAVTLDFPALRISASVDAAVQSLLLDKRAELAGALLGSAALEEEPAAAMTTGSAHD